MVWKTFRHTLQIVSAVLAGIALLALVAAWKLSQGPISIPQLTPYIVDAVSQNTRGMNLEIEDTILTWEGLDRTLDIKVVGANIFTRDGRRLATIPEAAVSLSGPALIDGIVAPKSVELIKPQINLVRHGDGTFAFELGDGMSVRADRAFELDQYISKIPDPQRPLSYLNKILVSNASINYEDKSNNTTFTTPNTTLEVERIGETLMLDTSLEMELKGKPAKIDLDASYNLTTEILDARSQIHSLHLGDVSSMLPELEELNALQTSIAGKVDFAIDRKGEVRSFFADLTAIGGTLTLPEPVAQTLDLDTLSVRLGYEDFNSRIRVEEALLALQPGSSFKTKQPFDHAMPMESIRITGSYDTLDDSFELDSFAFDLGEGPTGTVKGKFSGVLKGGERGVDIVGELLNVNPTNLHRYWPKGLNDDARDWVVNNIFDGVVSRAGINLSLIAKEDGQVIVNNVNGDMEMEGVSVDYLKPLPPAQNAIAWAEYDEKSFRITVTDGGVDKIKIKKAQIDIIGLDEYDQRLNLDMDLEGPLRDTLLFIDKEPLGFAKALEIDPLKTSGDTETNLKLSFLLLDDLTWDGVDVEASANGENIRIEDVVFDEDLSDGKIKLKVNKEGMDVEGKIVLGSIPADLKWRENFTKNTLFKRRFLLDGVVTDEQRVQELRLDFPPFTGDIMTGPIRVDTTIVESWDGHGTLETFADLKGAEVNIPVIHWQKKPDEAGDAYVKVNFDRDRLIGVPYFSIASKDLKASGSVGLDAKGKELQIIRVARFQAGRTDVTGGTVLYSAANGWEVDVHGNSLDLMPLLEGVRTADRTSEPTNKDTDLPGTFSGRFNQIWLDHEHSLKQVAGAVTSDGKLWTQAHLTGVVGGGEAFVIDLSPDGTNRRLLMETKDAGALLRALDLFDDMQGGDLVIDGVLNDDQPRRPLIGNINVKDYRITKVPALAKLLSLAALTGVVDSLQGDGIGFSNFTSPYKYDNGVIELKDGRTNGISIGLTWEGKLYTHAKVADLQGTVVPAYGLNSFLGNVPVVGQIFSGGEKGGGLFAWTFKITGGLDDPEVSINPVSALAPGVLRRIFQLDTPANDNKEETAKKETPVR